MQVVLASSSKYRSEQLRQLGLRHTAMAPDLDEDAIKLRLNLPPEELAVELGFRKADSLRKRFPTALLIGSDQMVVCEGKILGKGHTTEKTRAQLTTLSGRTHQLLTSLVVLTPDQTFRHLEVVEMKMRSLTAPAIEKYVQWDQPLDCAGSYKFEKAGICLMESVRGRDTSAILGLPLMALTNILLQLDLGFPFEMEAIDT
jgi:septum formation protein